MTPDGGRYMTAVLNLCPGLHAFLYGVEDRDVPFPLVSSDWPDLARAGAEDDVAA